MCSTTPELQQIIHDNTLSFYTKHHRMVKALAHSPNKSRMVHIVLFITVTWCEVNEPTLKTSLFYLAKKKKKRGLAHAKSAMNLVNGLSTNVPSANLTLIPNVLHYHLPLNLKFMTTLWPYSRSWSRSLAIFVVKNPKLFPTYVACLIVDFVSIAVVLPYHPWSNTYGTNTLLASLILLRPIILGTDFANFASKRWVQTTGFIIAQVVITLPILIVLRKRKA